MSPEYEALREKVARALFELTWDAQLLGAMRWEDTDSNERQEWFERADIALRAVAEAMREPSEAMQQAGASAVDGDMFPHNGMATTNTAAAECWRAMLAAHPLAEALRDE